MTEVAVEAIRGEMEDESRIMQPHLNADLYRSHLAPIPQSYRHLDAIEIAADGTSFVACSDLTGRMWNSLLRILPSPELLLLRAAPPEHQPLPLRDGAAAARFFPDSSKLAVGDDSGQVTLLARGDGWRPDRSECWAPVCSAVEHDEAVLAVDVFSSGERIVTGGADHNIKVWDTTLTSLQTIRPAHTRLVNDVATHPKNDSSFLSAGLDGVVAHWDIRDSLRAQVLLEAECGVRSIVWLSDKLFAAGFDDGQIEIGDLSAPHQIMDTIKLSIGPVHRLRYNERINCLAACSDSAVIGISKWSEGHTNIRPTLEYCLHDQYVRGLAWHHQHPVLFSCGWDGNIVQKDLSSFINHH